MSKQIAMMAPMAHQPAQLRTLIERFNLHRARNRVYPQTLAELRALSDRDLSDLGLSRSNIHSVAWDAANGAN